MPPLPKKWKTRCRACNGSGKSSTGKKCIPCGGSGRRQGKEVYGMGDRKELLPWQ